MPDDYLRDLQADQETRRARAATEPPIPHPTDITSLGELERQLPPASITSGIAIKITRDNGASWELGVVHGLRGEFREDALGYFVAVELGVFGSATDRAVTDHDFAGGLVVRLATREDCEGVTFSYAYEPVW